MTKSEITTLAEEFMAVRQHADILTPPSARAIGFDLTAGYAVGAELVRLRREQGWTPVGRKIGFTNLGLWESLGLNSPIWACTYDKTVQYAVHNSATLELSAMASPFIEPEIVFKLGGPLAAGSSLEAILQAVEWYALGFEVVDCNYPDWTFGPADAVADFGLHAALIVGDTHPVQDLEKLATQLPDMQVKLLKAGQLVAEGAGRNVLNSPALALGWLANTLQEQGAAPLTAGEIITTGTLTKALPVHPGEEWATEVVGIDLPPLALRFF